MAAVNGRTGKVSVRAIKDSYYYILPWWVKAILATIVGTGAVALGLGICYSFLDFPSNNPISLIKKHSKPIFHML